MKRYFAIILACSILFSCSEKKEKNDRFISDTVKSENKLVATDSIVNYNTTDSIMKLQEFRLYYKRLIQPVSFSKLTPVYSKPDTTSKIILNLSFNTRLKPIIKSEITDWFLIEYENDTAYLKTKDVAFYSFPSSKNHQITYFIRERKESSIILKYDFSQKKVIDSFEIEYFKPDYVGYINSEKWKNTDLLIYLNSDGNCCGCSSNQIYIIDANGQFEILFKTSQLIDDGDGETEYESYVQLPIDPEFNDIVYTEQEYYDEGESKNIKKHFVWDGVKLVEQKK